MSYPDAAWERAMTVQEVVLKALSAELHWFKAADILGTSARTLRRWRERYGRQGYVGLVGKRLHRLSGRVEEKRGGVQNRRRRMRAASFVAALTEKFIARSLLPAHRTGLRISRTQL